AEAWRGVDDARFSVDVSADANFIYVAVDVGDDSVRAEAGTPPWEQDGVEIRIDARPDPRRSHYGAGRFGREGALLALSPGAPEQGGWLYREGWMTVPEGVRTRCVTKDNGYSAEVAVPKAWVSEQ